MLPKIVLVGELLRSPIIAVANSGRKYARFNMVCSNYVSKTKTTESHFFNFVAFNPDIVRLLERLTPGTALFVIGVVKQSVYEADNKKVYSFNFECHQIEFVNRRRSNHNNNHFEPTSPEMNVVHNDFKRHNQHDDEELVVVHNSYDPMTDSNSVQAQAEHFAQEGNVPLDEPNEPNDAYSDEGDWDFDDFDFED